MKTTNKLKRQVKPLPSIANLFMIVILTACSAQQIEDLPSSKTELPTQESPKLPSTPTRRIFPTIQPSITPQIRPTMESSTIPSTGALAPYKGIWISANEINGLPTFGAAWENLKEAADQDPGTPKIKDQDQTNDVYVLAKALVYARTGEEKYRQQVIDNLIQAIGTEQTGRTLALGRNLVSYVIAADLVNLPADPGTDSIFRNWLREILTETLDEKTLRSTHEEMANNWGTVSGASRAAVAVYVGDNAELARTAQVFKGWLGDRSSYAGFNFNEDLSWQCDPNNPVGINPKGCTKEGHSIDGALPQEMRRGGSFKWPPDETFYVWGGLQGAVVQAEILSRAGYPAWEWQDQAIRRAYEFIFYQLGWKVGNDDEWQIWLVNDAYGTQFSTTLPTRPGQNMGWTDWTHAAGQAVGRESLYLPIIKQKRSIK